MSDSTTGTAYSGMQDLCSCTTAAVVGSSIGSTHFGAFTMHRKCMQNFALCPTPQANQWLLHVLHCYPWTVCLPPCGTAQAPLHQPMSPHFPSLLEQNLIFPVRRPGWGWEGGLAQSLGGRLC